MNTRTKKKTPIQTPTAETMQEHSHQKTKAPKSKRNKVKKTKTKSKTHPRNPASWLGIYDLVDLVHGRTYNGIQGAADIYRNDVPLRLIRLFKDFKLAGNHVILHEMALAGSDTTEEQLLIRPQVDEAHNHVVRFPASKPNDIPVFPFQT
jgi:hypothetical protein